MHRNNGPVLKVVEKTKTAIYARYSSHNQDDGTSIDVQLDVCRRAAGVPAADYIDRAVTGTTMQREAFSRLLEDCEAGRITTVYVYKWDRFGRSARAHAVLADLEDWGVKVISATEGAEPLSRGIQLVVAEDYSRKLGERVRAAKKLRFQQGGFNGGAPPFGYQIETQGTLKRLVPDWGGQAEVVRWMFKTYSRDCIGTKQMARLLNKKGIKARRAEYWGASAVRIILGNTIYVGRPVRLGKVPARQRHQGLIYHSDPNRVERADDSLRIVDDETFQTVQTKQRSRKVLRPIGQNRTRRFSKLLRCGCCGSVFVRTGHNRPDDQNQYWTCGLRQRQDTRKCPNAVYLNEQDLVARIQAGLASVFEDADGIIAEAMSRAADLARAGQSQAVELDKRLVSLDGELDRLARMLIDSDLSDPAVKRLLSKQVAEKTAERDRVQTSRTELASGGENRDATLAVAVRRTFEQAKDSLAKITSDSEYNQFVRDFVGPTVVYPDGTIRDPAGMPQSSALADGASIVRAAFWAQEGQVPTPKKARPLTAASHVRRRS